MSLFGQSPDQSALFGSDSLFGPEPNSSPWGLNKPSLQRKTASNLLSDGSVFIPPEYNEIYRQEQSHSLTSQGVDIEGLKDIFNRAGLENSGLADSILSTVAVTGGAEIDHGAWNVAMALIAMAQNGEEDLSLDAVYARKSNLPVPVLGPPTTATATVSPPPPVSAGTSITGSIPVQHNTDNPPPDPWVISSPSAVHHEAPSASFIDNTHHENQGFTYQPPKFVYDANRQDSIKVSIVPEKKGVFMFKHVDFLIDAGGSSGGGGGDQQVIRRYKDFVWLLEFLLKRYPFRCIPLLPPKRLTVNGHYLSSDAAFLEKRRRGLQRFLNQLNRHPILSKESVVVNFMSLPTELQIWKKQAMERGVEEFRGRIISQDFIESWDETNDPEKMNTISQGVQRGGDIYNNLCVLIDHLSKRIQGTANEYLRTSVTLSAIKEASRQCYVYENGDLDEINRGVDNVANRLTTMQELLMDQAKCYEIGLLESLKSHRDILFSVRELFDRHAKLAINNIPQLESRIESSEIKLKQLQAKPSESIKPTEISKIQLNINRDRESIQSQTNRNWLIRECLKEELSYFQQYQYQISTILQDWSIDSIKYTELLLENFKHFSDDSQAMPSSSE